MQLFIGFTYQLMLFLENAYVIIWGAIFFTAGLISMTPLSVDNTLNFFQVILVYIRRLILTVALFVFSVLPASYLLYTADMGTPISFFNWVFPILIKTFATSLLSLFFWFLDFYNQY